MFYQKIDIFNLIIIAGTTDKAFAEGLTKNIKAIGEFYHRKLAIKQIFGFILFKYVRKSSQMFNCRYFNKR